uniref:TBC1 domain family member 5 n=1 Tax=Anthurium amnicola TaxID=1678845 RepID=A0A1D1Z5D2_9ARAE
MPPVPAGDAQMAQPSSSFSPPRGSCADRSRFSNLRGVRWRMDLGVLPSSVDASIEVLRRVAADSRRRYAILRRRLLIDPHINKDGNKCPELVMDNPLSQNPESMWGRFFQNAELEKMVDQDLSRLYPEQGSYFQTTTCQVMLRRILLLWCLRHPQYGYRQGMHELLAPLVYVLHIDVQCLSEVRKRHENHFNDEFDGRSFSESGTVSKYGFAKSKSWDGETDEEDFLLGMSMGSNLDELDPETRDIILLSDAYGTEGELGIVLSERFMEHDAYCMFDALMNGAHGVVAVADFFSLSPASGSSTGLTPVIEASSALYHLLSIVDPPLHSHLIELGVEPQYFALRWLRVLFGREFLLQGLLVIWDEIFSSSNTMCHLSAENEAQLNFRILCSPRGAFISAMAVSMILHLRSSLLATENVTTCLQRLLNFPENVNMKKLIDKAKSLQDLAVDINISTHSGPFSGGNSSLVRGYSISSGSVSPKTPLYSLPESYWEEKWQVLHRAEELRKASQSDPISKGILNRSFGRGRFILSRTESDPSPAKIMGEKKDNRAPVRRRLFDDLSQEVDAEVSDVKVEQGGLTDPSGAEEPLSAELAMEKNCPDDSTSQNTMEKHLYCMGEETSLSGENSSLFSTATSPVSVTHEHENGSEKSSVTSNSCTGDDEDEVSHAENSFCNTSSNHVPGDLEASSTATTSPGHNIDVAEKQEEAAKEKKPSSNRFQWFWIFGKGASEGNVEKGTVETRRSTTGNLEKDVSGSSVFGCGTTSRTEAGDNRMMGTLKNIGQSMLENIQVLESVFQQDRGQVGSLENLSNNILGGKGQATAMSALKELRKISNLLFEM